MAIRIGFFVIFFQSIIAIYYLEGHGSLIGIQFTMEGMTHIILKKDGITFTLTPLQEDDKAKGNTTKLHMFGKKEFVKIEEEKKEECVATLGLEGARTVSLNNDSILKGKDDEKNFSKIGLEKIEDELFVRNQDGLEKCAKIMIGKVFFPLVATEVKG